MPRIYDIDVEERRESETRSLTQSKCRSEDIRQERTDRVQEKHQNSNNTILAGRSQQASKYTHAFELRVGSRVYETMMLGRNKTIAATVVVALLLLLVCGPTAAVRLGEPEKQQQEQRNLDKRANYEGNNGIPPSSFPLVRTTVHNIAYSTG